MDGNRFDAITKALTAETSRRRTLSGLLGGALGAIATILGGRPTLAACSGGAEACNSDADCPRAGTRCQQGCCFACAAAGASCGNRLCCRVGGRNLSCCNGTCCNATCCNGRTCANTQTSNTHCGRCNNACGRGNFCSRGLCCPKGTVNCGGRCTNLQTSDNHCGECNKRCPNVPTITHCSNGKCCPTGTVNCNGTCADPRSSPAHCGKCGNSCDGGRCVRGVCGPPPPR